jgi:hypothetical protein
VDGEIGWKGPEKKQLPYSYTVKDPDTYIFGIKVKEGEEHTYYNTFTDKENPAKYGSQGELSEPVDGEIGLKAPKKKQKPYGTFADPKDAAKVSEQGEFTRPTVGKMKKIYEEMESDGKPSTSAGIDIAQGKFKDVYVETTAGKNDLPSQIGKSGEADRKPKPKKKKD